MRETYLHYLQLRQELTRWLTQSALMDGPGRNRGGEDEAPVPPRPPWLGLPLFDRSGRNIALTAQLRGCDGRGTADPAAHGQGFMIDE